MLTWHSIIFGIATLVIGFFLRILQERIHEKKVSLSHRMDGPAVFSDIPPKVCFQTLRIFNKGKLPAKNVRVCLDEESIKNCHAEYKPLTEDDFSVETKESVRILKFERLLPGDGLPISFKSSAPLPEKFVAWVKSDEMVSQVSRGEPGVSPSLIPYVALISALAAFSIFLYVIYTQTSLRMIPSGPAIESKIPEKAKPFVKINLMTDKPVYSKREQMELIYKIRNVTGQSLRDFFVITEIPGFDLDSKATFKAKNFLAAEEEFFQKIPLRIPNDIPPGRYKITLLVRAESIDKTLSDEAQTFFDIK